VAAALAGSAGRPTRGGIAFEIRVIPRAPRTAIDGLRDGRVLIRVTAAPVDDAANDAVVEAVARALGVPRRLVRITAGFRSRNKTVEVQGIQ